MSRPTDAVQRAREVIASIPAGEVMTYAEIGRLVGLGPRQVGRVVSQLGDHDPWWRIIYADGSPATCHDAQAQSLLRSEGVAFRNGRVDLHRRDTPTTSAQLAALRLAITKDEANREHVERGWLPIYTASPAAKVAIIGQAPGLRAQRTGLPWNDPSGKKLMHWLGVTEEQFRDPDLFAILPMDFYFPGAGTSGDIPPRRGFAERWHPQLLALMPNIEVRLLVGRYAQRHYLPDERGPLTDVVRNYRSFLPLQFPIVHPSPRNFRWHLRNPWFEETVVPALRERVHAACSTNQPAQHGGG